MVLVIFDNFIYLFRLNPNFRFRKKYYRYEMPIRDRKRTKVF